MSIAEDEVPQGWRLAKLGDIGEVSGGLTRNASKRDSSTNRVPLVSVAAVQLRRIDIEAVGEVGLLDSDGDRATLRAGDLLVVEGNGSLDHIGRVALWNDEIPGARHQNHIIRVRPHQLSSRYVLEWLASPAGRDAIIAEATSAAGLYTLSLSKVERIPVPVPPAGLDQRIVAKLDALQARSGRAKEALDAIPALLERFRQSVLAAAFRGDLTADWRAKNPDVEPASELLKRIRAERRRRWEEAELAKMKAKGKGPGDDRWKAKYEEPESVNLEGLSDLPPGWAWASADELCESGRPIIYGIIKAGPDFPGGVPYVRVTEVAAGIIRLQDLPRCDPARAAMFKRSTLKAGDLLVSKDGTIGKVTIVPPELEGGNINQHVLRFAPHPFVDRQFLMRVVEAPASQRWMKGEQKGIALQGVNVEDFRRMPLPLAPADEQVIVAQRIERAWLRLSPLDLSAAAARSDITDLDKAILAKAFRGELVPQDPNDEPASELLARIAAERNGASNGAAPTSARRGKRAPRKKA